MLRGRCLSQVSMPYLADPAVMSVLFSLLEGAQSIRIPGSTKEVYAKPGFRFFATQNGASEGGTSYGGRNQLPIALRNRFLEVQVGEFPEDELADIIRGRKDAKSSIVKHS